ncbi:MAG: DUF192 domain-containing protein [Alphaproteobacteria bacterium]|nr:DUF192 domain-containing protein [Alphaproteobacteria bacterium]
MQRLLFGAFVASAVALAACEPNAQQQTQAQAPAAQRTDQLFIETASGRHPFRIEVAVTPEQKATGLMFRRELAPDAGMLFTYEQPQIIQMWMRNTYIPLDMVFVGADGRVINVAERTVPESLTIVPSAAPAVGVVELVGGTAARLRIRPGNRVLHPFFGTAAAP